MTLDCHISQHHIQKASWLNADAWHVYRATRLRGSREGLSMAADVTDANFREKVIQSSGFCVLARDVLCA